MAADYAFTSRWVPAALAAGVLLAGYVVGPAVGWALFRLTTAVDNNLADLGDHPEGATP